MKRINRFHWLRILVVLAALTSLASSGFAQDARLQLSNLDKLSDKAAEVNDVTLDGATLQLASAFVNLDNDPNADQVKSMIKNLKGIYIKNFKFHQPNAYSQADVDSIRAQLAAPGWSKIVGNRDKDSGATNEIYLMKDGDRVAGLAILSAEAKELSVVNIVGRIDFAELGALGGKFGIPKLAVPPKETAPNGAGKSQAPPPGKLAAPPPAGEIR